VDFSGVLEDPSVFCRDQSLHTPDMRRCGKRAQAGRRFRLLGVLFKQESGISSLADLIKHGAIIDAPSYELNAGVWFKPSRTI
jgi:hypothetical protein